jgi:hypothetical protein
MDVATRTSEIDALAVEYPDVPPEAIFKEDLLRIGVDFTDEALRYASGFKPKSYFIFSFDRRPIAGMERDENLKAPEEVALSGGPRGFRRTVVSVRLNPGSPHTIDLRDGTLAYLVDGVHVANVELQKTPSYYERSLSNGKTITEMAPTIEWGYLIYLTVYRKCQYFGFQEECAFCDINENVRQQKAAGRSYNTVKAVDEILEALAIIDEEDTDQLTRAYTVTGGSVTKHLGGLAEAEFYGQYVRAINERFPGRWISKLVVQALPREDLESFRDSGVQIYHPNYEVWDAEIFSKICPGKERYIGREEWMRRILVGAEVFGPSHVIPNFVAGVEMAKPHGFATVEEALRSTGEGLDFFMSRGVTPRFTTWCPEPLSSLGRDQGPAPLAYHVRLLRLWRETLQRYDLPAPPGYGDPGVGQAVFSVSGFMDALPVETAVAAV